MKDKIAKLRTSLMNVLNMENKKFQLGLNVILIVVINIAAAAFSVKIDLTSSNTYSLTKHSREIVSGLNEKLKIKVFFSKDLSGEQAIVFRYLKDVLEEYNFYGNRNFSYEMIDKISLFLPAKLGFLTYIGSDYHFQNIAKGVIDSRDIIYFISVCVLSLMFTIKAVEERR